VARIELWRVVVVRTGFGFPVFVTNSGLAGVHDFDTTTTVAPLCNLSHCSIDITHAPESYIKAIKQFWFFFDFFENYLGILDLFLFSRIRHYSNGAITITAIIVTAPLL